MSDSNIGGEASILEERRRKLEELKEACNAKHQAACAGMHDLFRETAERSNSFPPKLKDAGSIPLLSLLPRDGPDLLYFSKKIL